MATEETVPVSGDLAWALGEFDPKNPRLKAYKTFEDYYDGNQRLAFASPKYRNQFWKIFRGYCDNMCQSVVDVQAERLEVIGFTSSEAKPTTVTYDANGNEVDPANPPMEDRPNPIPAPVDAEGVADPNHPTSVTVPAKTITITVVEDEAGDRAWAEWESESMPLVADLVHTDVFKYGDGYVMADDQGVWRQHPSEMAVRYSKEQPGLIEAAAKFWIDEGGEDPRGHLNVYTPAGVVKYQSVQPVKNKRVDMKPDAWEDTGEGGTLPQGIPVVHFANKTYGEYGISELAAVIPLQDALNKAEMDLILSMEYQAFRQRWVAGVDVELDENGKPKGFVGEHGAGKYLAFADGDVKVGEFGAAELKPYIDVIENLRAQIARVTGIPPHYFFVGSSGATVSGETLKVSESRFTRKGERQQRVIGKGWEQVMDLVLEITSTLVDDSPYSDSLDLNATWEEPTPRSESEDMDVLVKKGTIGVPNSQLQREAGYDPDQIVEFAAEYAANVKAGLQAAPGKSQDGGNLVPAGSGQTSGNAESGNTGAQGTQPAQE